VKIKCYPRWNGRVTFTNILDIILVKSIMSIPQDDIYYL
jgi:hypothetical protein